MPASTDFASAICAMLSEQSARLAESAPGSNAFAIQKPGTTTAMLACDLHLPLSVPNTWYRTEILWYTAPNRYRTVDGITLPGMPVVVAGSNGAISWGMTNAYADTADMVVLETDQANPRRYRTPDGWREFTTVTETLAVRGSAPQTLSFDSTIWGPVWGTDHRGRRLALHWVMADPAAYDLNFSAIETVNTARTALAFAKNSGMPHVNFVVADNRGNIGWTVGGRLPKRIGFNGSTPCSWADGDRHWDGWQPLERHPQVYNPESGSIWSANSRTVGGDELAVLGDGGYEPGARARQIRDRLAGLKNISPESLLDIQLDVRGLYLEPWQQLLLSTLTPAAVAAKPDRSALRSEAETWGGEALPSSVGYRLVHDFRQAVLQRLDPLVFGRCRAVYPNFSTRCLNIDRIALALAERRPAGWHPAGEAGWRQLLLDAVDATLADAGGPAVLAQRTWGQANRLQMVHPFSRVYPWLGWILDMPSTEMPGDDMVVRAQTPDFGASVRMVLWPGHEDESILHLPGGQCGNPLSPYYSKGHKDWLRGEATPLRPGSIEKKLIFVPPPPEK
jgi:penicillin amidase